MNPGVALASTIENSMAMVGLGKPSVVTGHEIEVVIVATYVEQVVIENRFQSVRMYSQRIQHRVLIRSYQDPVLLMGQSCGLATFVADSGIESSGANMSYSEMHRTHQPTNSKVRFSFGASCRLCCVRFWCYFATAVILSAYNLCSSPRQHAQ